MPRLLTALATLAVGLFAPVQPPHSRVASPAPSSISTAPQGSTAGLPPGATAARPAAAPATAAPEAATGILLPEADLDTVPEAVIRDIAAFGASQHLDAPDGLRAWITDLDGDGHDDVLTEARFGAKAATLYHFPYFAIGEGYRRGSAMTLAQGIVSVAKDGRRLLVTVRQGPATGEASPADEASRSVIRLSF